MGRAATTSDELSSLLSRADVVSLDRAKATADEYSTPPVRKPMAPKPEPQELPETFVGPFGCIFIFMVLFITLLSGIALLIGH